MSKPKAPYYYKEKSSDAYHWELSCHDNHYPADGWVKSDKPPSNREQCIHCQQKK